MKIKRVDGSSNTVTVIGTAGQTIDSNVSVALTNGSNFQLSSLNNNWHSSLWNLHPGSLAEANFYALSPPDNAVAITAGNPVSFPNDGIIFGNITRASIHRLNWELNGSLLPDTVVGMNVNGGLINGESLVSATLGSTIRIVYPAGNVLPINITQNAGGTSASTSHLLITRVR